MKVFILFLVLAICIPIYILYTQDSPTAEAQAGIGTIYYAVKEYYTDHKEDTQGIEQLIEMKYLELPGDLSEKWTFSLVGRNPVMQIMATSTKKMKGGEGHVILFDIKTGQFMGYGLPSE